MCPKKNFLVIGGGVGPAAGVMFHDKIVNMADNRRMADQGHAPVIHLSMSPYVLDRTKFLLENPDLSIPNPGINMGLAVREACKAYECAAQNFVVGVPCNTFHSPAVYSAYESSLRHPRIKLINMIGETACHPMLEENDRNHVEKIILLSTRGTRDTGVYDRYFKTIPLTKCSGGPKNSESDLQKTYFSGETASVKKDVVQANMQGAVMAAIYDPVHGVKGKEPNLKRAFELFEAVVEILVGDSDPNNCRVIMGCTEIPLAYLKRKQEDPLVLEDFKNYVDPMDCLAKAMILAGGYALKTNSKGDVESAEIPQINKQNAEEFTRDLAPILRARL